MKVMIPVEIDQSIVCITFGRAPYFAIYNTETDTYEITRNPAAAVQGGAGINAAQFVVDCKVDAVIASQCGQNSANVLKSANIKIYKSGNLSVKQNITDLKEGKLTVMQDFSSGYHGGR
ncbi:MAG: NifB/NifX family molybdenum-iron cluster-binding protein [Oliverpabstia sp.]